MATCSLLAAAMLPGASTIKEEAYFNAVSAPTSATLVQAFFDFFDELVADLVLDLGVKTSFSALEFSSLASFPLLTAGGLGDGNLGDKGGDGDEGLILPELLEVGNGKGGKGGEEMGDFGMLFVIDFRLSKL